MLAAQWGVWQNGWEMLRFAHLSDPHFGHFSWSPAQFFSKRWVGNWNYLLVRKWRHSTVHLSALAAFINGLGVDGVFLTGDLTTTAQHQEFKEASAFTALFRAPLSLLPGNHDRYTQEAMEEQLFENYFPQEKMLFPIKENWWGLSLDCAFPTPIGYANGRFTSEQERSAEERLATLPKEASVVLICHFPLFDSGDPRHDLLGNERLQALVRRWPCIKLYLHGHLHTPFIDERLGYPLVVNAGCCATREGSFFLLEIEEQRCTVKHYGLRGGNWHILREQFFQLR